MSENTDSPASSYPMALREAKHIVRLLAERMTTPLADTQQPSLVDFSLSSTPGSTGDEPRRNLFQSPAVENKGTFCPVSLLDTTNPKSPTSWSVASVIEAVKNKLNVGGASSGGPEAVLNPAASDATAESAPFLEMEAGCGDNSIKGGAHHDANELPLLKSQRDGVVPTVPTFAATTVEESPDRCQDKMPLICFTPMVEGNPTRACLAQSDLEVVLPSRMVDEDCLAVRSSIASDRRLSFTVAPAVNPVEVEEASTATTALLSNGGPPFTAADKCKVASAKFPDPPALCDSSHSHAHSSEAGGDDSFLTAYDSPVHPSWGSFVFSMDDEPLALSDGPVACDQDALSKALDGASASDLPTAAVAGEATFTLLAQPSKPAPRPQVPARTSAPADTTVVVARAPAPRKPMSRPAGSILATRKSLLPPPVASQRQGLSSTLVKPRAPLGRPSVACKAAESTFSVDPAAQMAPPASAPKVAPLQQPKKQEQASVRPKVPAPRGPICAPSAAAFPASRQSMPAPGVANGAVRRTVVGRRSVVTKTTAPPESSVSARPTRLPPPTTTAGTRSATVRLSKLSAPTSRGGASKVQASLPKPRQANGKPEPQPPAEPQAQNAQVPRSRTTAPKTRVAGSGFSRLPSKVGSSAGNRAAVLAPVPESAVLAHLSSTPVRSHLPPPGNAAFPELTPIRRP